MEFLKKLMRKFQTFMIGRNGVDQLTRDMSIAALFLMLVVIFTGSALFDLIALFLYGVCMFRMFSRNIAVRYEENRKYVEWKQRFLTSMSQKWIRLKNIKKYRYFKCPECGALLKLPRKVGEVTVTCGKCRHAFKQKA